MPSKTVLTAHFLAFGGLGNNTSIVILAVFSSTSGINLDKYGDERARHGLVFTSIIHGFQFVSTMKSYPRSSKLCERSDALSFR